MLKRGILYFTAGLFLLLATTARAAKGRENEQEVAYEKELAAIDAALVPVFREAGAAFDRSDFPKAEKLYRSVYERAPNWDVVVRRLGSSLVYQKKRAEGLAFCERAVALRRSADNLIILARNMSTGTELERTSAETVRAKQLAAEALSLTQSKDIGVLAGAAHVYLSAQDQTAFRSVLDKLEAQAPDEISTHYYLAIDAAMGEHWMLSEDEIRKAEKLGFPHEAAEEFLSVGIGSRATGWRTALYASVIVALWAAGFVVLFGLGYVLSKMTLRQAENADIRFTVNTSEHRLRSIYRAVINIAGIYYYVSLPIVVVLVLGIVAALLYVFLCIGQIPIKLMLIFGIGAVLTIISLVKSLLVKVKTEDPGRALKREEAEGLWQLTEEVARAVNTRPIDEIRITTGTDLAVYERGTWREKLQNKATRILILGVGVLNDFKIDDFRAVLAHEYGHFSNRDTAGGDIALRVRNDIMKFYYAMLEAGQATYMNVAFHFLRLYNFIFRRISHGATRLQEILADRVAAQCYGAPAFEGGLRHVIRRSIEFHRNANIEVDAGVKAKRPLANLYDFRIEGDTSLEKEFEKSINRETTDDDTHPSPKDRFRLVAALPKASCAPRHGEVWSLFRNREGLVQEMMGQVERNVAQYRERGDPTLESLRKSAEENGKAGATP